MMGSRTKIILSLISACLGVIACIFLIITRYHETRKAAAEADIAEKLANKSDTQTDTSRTPVTASTKTGDNAVLGTKPKDLKASGNRMGRGSLRAFVYPDYVAHGGHLGLLNSFSKVTSTVDERANATFEIVPGLAKPTYVSLQAVNLPRHYLCHGDYVIRLQPMDNTPGFRLNATFAMVPGLAGGDSVSFRSINYSQRYIHHRSNQLYLDTDDRSPRFGEDASFYVVKPLAE
ncbi:MAG: hypothetical protein C0467_30720 [Planctomycetaceae bacterium]|nr:hypothetical protein [Planctomycetaceae bacterium]